MRTCSDNMGGFRTSNALVGRKEREKERFELEDVVINGGKRPQKETQTFCYIILLD